MVFSGECRAKCIPAAIFSSGIWHMSCDWLRQVEAADCVFFCTVSCGSSLAFGVSFLTATAVVIGSQAIIVYCVHGFLVVASRCVFSDWRVAKPSGVSCVCAYRRKPWVAEVAVRSCFLAFKKTRGCWGTSWDWTGEVCIATFCASMFLLATIKMFRNMAVPQLIWSCGTTYVFFDVIFLERCFI